MKESIKIYINPFRRFIGSFIPEWLEEMTEISDGAKIVYARLARYAGKDGSAFPKQQTLANATGKPLRTLKRCLKELCDNGLLESKQRGLGMPNVYFFLEHPAMKDNVLFLEVPPTARQEVPPVAQAYKENQFKSMDIERQIVKYFIDKVDGKYEALPAPETYDNIKAILRKSTPEQIKKVIYKKAAQFHAGEIDARIFNMKWLLRPDNFFTQLSIIEKPAKKKQADKLNGKQRGAKVASAEEWERAAEKYKDGWQ